MSSSTVSQDPKRVDISELIRALRLPQSYATMHLRIDGRQFTISYDDWSFILDAALAKLAKEAE